MSRSSLVGQIKKRPWNEGNSLGFELENSLHRGLFCALKKCEKTSPLTPTRLVEEKSQHSCYQTPFSTFGAAEIKESRALGCQCRRLLALFKSLGQFMEWHFWPSSDGRCVDAWMECGSDLQLFSRSLATFAELAACSLSPFVHSSLWQINASDRCVVVSKKHRHCRQRIITNQALKLKLEAQCVAPRPIPLYEHTCWVGAQKGTFH